jgi:hypothetical protein
MNSEDRFEPRREAKRQFLQNGTRTKITVEQAVNALAASDAQYAIEAEFLATKTNTDALLVIDPLPLFQIEKHEIGSQGKLSYIIPLEK